MKQRSINLVALAALVAVMTLVGTPVYAQGGGTTASISGTVADASGAVIPGANVKVKNTATGADFTSVTAENGTFTIQAVQPGSYTVTVSLMGFKTAVAKDVVVNAGVPSSVRIALEVGGLEETVVVSGASEILQTQTAAVATTLDVNQIAKLPVGSRSVLDFVVNLPGVNTPGGSRDSTINGLPQSVINITIDGMSVQDNHLKTGDGFFARVSPRIDAVEEVTVSTAAQGVQTTGQGAVQIQFVTRSGSNRFSGSTYYYLQHHKLNSNTFFNNLNGLPKAEDILHQPGGRAGGPIVIPGVVDWRDRAFFFINYEESRQPAEVPRTRTILHPDAQRGVFRYNTSTGVERVDMFALMAGNSATAPFNAMDPTISKLLSDIRAAASSVGTIRDIEDPSLQEYNFQVARRGITYYPTVRLDYNLTDKHRLSGSWNFTNLLSDPDTLNGRDPVFPGFPIFGAQHSRRYAFQTNLRSTFGGNLVNEFKVGYTGGATLFSPEIKSQPWGGSPIGDQAGFLLGISTANISNASSGTGYQAREASTNLVENNLNWLKGAHSLTIGGSWTEVDLWLENQTVVPTVSFDIVTGDPANALFSAANFPGSSSDQRADAGDLYAVLTGRVTSINRDIRLNEETDEYELLGSGIQRGRMREIGLFVSDSWRFRPNLTLNFGLRYELQLPFYPLNNSYSTATAADICGVSGVANGASCNLFQPGVMPGKRPEYIPFNKGDFAYKKDRNNFAPNVAVAWTLNPRNGFLRTLFGHDGDSVLRAGYSLAYSRNGTSDFSGVLGANPGVTVSANRSTSLTGSNALNNDGRGLPLMFRDSNRLGPPAFPLTRAYPLTDVITGDVQIFDPGIVVPYAQTWTAGWQRKLTRDTAVEIRYVGTRSDQGWTTYNYNEANIVENNFLNEFRLAQRNLRAHVAVGCGAEGQPDCSFAYRGPGTGTFPLPIYLAYLNGRSNADSASAYTGTAWTSSNWIDPLNIHDPNPFTPAGTGSNTGLDGSATRRDNAALVGLPANFFRANPDLQGGGIVTGNGLSTRFHGMQFELRKRLSSGLQVQGSYAFGEARENVRHSFRTPRTWRLDTGGEGGVTHAFKANWVYELPFGQGRRFGQNAGPWLDRLIGGWSIDGIARLQSGRMVDFGNVQLVGMSKDDVKKMFNLRFDRDNRLIFMLPQDVVDNTVKAFSVDATSPTGYSDLGVPQGRYFAPANGPDCIEVAGGFGDCGVRTLVVTGPRLVRFDLSTTKRLRIAGRTNAEFRAEFLNAFNTTYFTPVTGIGDDPNDYRVTGGTSGRTIQIVSRFSW